MTASAPQPIDLTSPLTKAERALAVALLRGAARRVQRGWSPHASALKRKGDGYAPCASDDLKATHWSILGAMAAALAAAEDQAVKAAQYPAGRRALHGAWDALDAVVGGPVSDWEDADGRTHAEAVEAIEAAAARLLAGLNAQRRGA